jgi:hypothetical protein
MLVNNVNLTMLGDELTQSERSNPEAARQAGSAARAGLFGRNPSQYCRNALSKLPSASRIALSRGTCSGTSSGTIAQQR